MSKKGIIILGFSILIVLIALLLVAKVRNKQIIPEQQASQPVHKLKAQIQKNSPLTLPKIHSTSDAKSLPADLQFLLLNAATEQKIQSVVYENGHSGYLVNIKVDYAPKTAYSVYRNLFRERSWTRPYAAQADDFALVAVENSSYQVVVSIDTITSESVNITIQTIAK